MHKLFKNYFLLYFTCGHHNLSTFSIQNILNDRIPSHVEFDLH